MPRKRRIDIIADRIDKISTYRKSSEPGTYFVETTLDSWIWRIQLLNKIERQIDDPRIRKAVRYIAFALIGNGFYMYVVDTSLPRLEDIAFALRHLEHEQLADTLIDLSHDARLSEYKLDVLISSTHSRKAKQLLREAKKTVSRHQQLQQELKYFYEQIDLWNCVYMGIRDALLYGDAFFEKVYSPQELIALIPLNIRRIIPKIDKKGTIVGWYYLDSADFDMATVFQPYQVVRFSTDKTHQDIGEGLLISNVRILKMVRDMERVLMITREARSRVIRVHYPDFSNVGVGYGRQLSDREIEEYQNRVQTTLRRSIDADIYSSGLWRVDVLPTDATPFTRIDDIKHFHQLLEMGLLLPVGVLDSGENVNRATLDLQLRFLKGYINILKQEAIKAMKDVTYTHLYLKGEDIDNIDVRITIPDTGLLDLVEASQVITRINNRYNRFPKPYLSMLLGLDWDDYINFRDIELQDYEKELPTPSELMALKGKYFPEFEIDGGES